LAGFVSAGQAYVPEQGYKFYTVSWEKMSRIGEEREVNNSREVGNSRTLSTNERTPATSS
jgi:hypothetical protein